MASPTKRPVRRHRHHAYAAIPCCHGWIYTISEDHLGIISESADAILNRLREIDGVKVVEVRGRWCDLMCPPLRLPDIAAVMVPMSSVHAPATLARAAHRGRIW